MKFGKWKRINGDYTTPGDDPIFVCGMCGETWHHYGANQQNRKLLCDGCGRVNIYPWECAFEIGSSLWENDGGDES